jgi:hypothetical protein
MPHDVLIDIARLGLLLAGVFLAVVVVVIL